MPTPLAENARFDRPPTDGPEAAVGAITGDNERSEFWAAGPGLIVFVALCPAIFGRYGFADDYVLLYLAKVDPPQLASTMIGAGRILTVPLYQFLFTCAGTIDRLGLVRVVCALGVAACASIFSVIVRRLGFRPPLAFLAGVALVVLPSMVVAGTWANCFMCSWAMFLSLWAGQRLLIARVQFGRHFAEAVALLSTAACLYQPGAMAFWLVWLAWVLSPNWPDVSWQRIRRVSASFLAAMVVCCAVALIVQRTGARLTHLTGERATLTTNVREKLDFLFSVVWPRVVEPWSRQPRLWVGLPILLALFLTPRMSWRRRTFRLFAIGAVLVLGYAPNIAVSENWASSRSMLTLMPILPITLIAIVEDAMNRWGLARRHVSLQIVVGAATVLSAAFTATFVQSNIVLVQEYELALARQAIDKATDAPSLTLLPARWWESFASFIDHDELGIPSTCQRSTLVPLTELVYQESHGIWYGKAHARTREDTTPITDAAVLDFAWLLDPKNRRQN